MARNARRIGKVPIGAMVAVGLTLLYSEPVGGPSGSIATLLSTRLLGIGLLCVSARLGRQYFSKTK